MIRYILTLVMTLVMALAIAGCSEHNTGSALDSGQPITVNFASLQGRWVVINYWAEWCMPCIKEIPELNELAQEYPDITVLGINYDGAEGAELQRQVSLLGIEFPLLADDPAMELGYARPLVLPTTVVLNPVGNIAATLVGPQTLASLARATQRE